jgi:hypothetical protein
MSSWDKISAELSQLSQVSNQNEYKFLRPVLDSIQGMVNSRIYPPEIVSGVLDRVKSVQAEASKGTDPHDLVEEMAGSGFIQPGLKVSGDLYQASRDVNQAAGDINNIAITVFETKLGEIKREILEPRIHVPVVLLVMTADEAQQLVAGEAFQDYAGEIYAEEFKQLEVLLGEKKISDWRKRYGKVPEEWKPFADTPKTISDLVAEGLDSVEGSKNPLVPKFFDIRTINQDTQPMRRSLRNLREKGCIVVMDTISMRHPVIQRAYRRSLLDAFPNVLFVRIAPIDDALKLMQQMIRFKEQYVDLEVYKRFKVDQDGRSDEVSEDFRFTRWVKDQMPKLLSDDDKVKSVPYVWGTK